MTTISGAVPAVQFSPPVSAEPTSSPAPAKAAAATPSDTVAISASTATASGTPVENRVDSLMDEIKTHNDIADARAHFDWAGLAKDIGQALTTHHFVADRLTG